MFIDYITCPRGGGDLAITKNGEAFTLICTFFLPGENCICDGGNFDSFGSLSELFDYLYEWRRTESEDRLHDIADAIRGGD